MMVERTCNCFEEMEKALERIRDADKVTEITWKRQVSDGILRTNTEIYVSCNKVCDLPAAILELADKVKPPKPKEREWARHDVVGKFNTHGAMYQGPHIISRLPCEETMTFMNDFYRNNRKFWRNLSIEAEMEGEK